MAKQSLAVLALVCLMLVYLPFHVIGRFCDAVGRHAVDLAERIDGWLSNG
jgi:hypothetical protein